MVLGDFFCHRAGLITSTAKSLDILRQNIQRFINKEIDVIIQDYMEVIRTVLYCPVTLRHLLLQAFLVLNQKIYFHVPIMHLHIRVKYFHCLYIKKNVKKQQQKTNKTICCKGTIKHLQEKF